MRHFLYLILMLVVIPAFAQGSKDAGSASTENSKEKADILINQVCNEYQSFKSMKVNFILTTVVNGYPRSVDTIKGQVQDEQYRLSMATQEIACNGKSVWFFNKKQNSIKRVAPDPSEVNLAFPHKMLRRYQQQYDYEWLGEAKLGKHLIQKIDFFPSSVEDIYKIRVYIDKTSSQILSITRYGKNGTNYKLDFRNVLYNVKIDPKTFILEMS